MNKAIIVGRLGENAEVIKLNNDKIMVKLIVATRDRDEVDWHQVKVVNHGLALTCQKCPKGQLISVSGSIKTKSYVDSNGKKQYSTYILAEEVNFLSPLSKNEDK